MLLKFKIIKYLWWRRNFICTTFWWKFFRIKNIRTRIRKFHLKRLFMTKIEFFVKIVFSMKNGYFRLKLWFFKNRNIFLNFNPKRLFSTKIQTVFVDRRLLKSAQVRLVVKFNWISKLPNLLRIIVVKLMRLEKFLIYHKIWKIMVFKKFSRKKYFLFINNVLKRI